MAQERYLAPAGLRIGHIHLKVADLDRAIAFYRDRMGFDLLFNLGTFAFLSVNRYHHHIGLNTWESKNAARGPNRAPGLYHFALNYPTQDDLARAVIQLKKSGWPIDGSADHTSHLAVYLSDPDGNGIELAWDRDPSFWAGWLSGVTAETVGELNKPFDVEAFCQRLGEDGH